jgi:hypothetical protein
MGFSDAALNVYWRDVLENKNKNNTTFVMCRQHSGGGFVSRSCNELKPINMCPPAAPPFAVGYRAGSADRSKSPAPLLALG